LRNRRKKRAVLGRIYSFAITWAVLSFIFPLYRLTGLLAVAGISAVVAFFLGRAMGKADRAESGTGEQAAENNPVAGTKRASDRTGTTPAAQKRRNRSAEAEKPSSGPAQKKSYGPEIDPLVEEGNRALSEMGRLYMSIKDPEVRMKINEIMRITDKITQDAIQDPSDIPQIKKFFRYYLPTTIKLLNSYDRMASQGIEGENIDKSMKNITEMLDVAIAAYKKRLDSLFENQALDIETDIDVMNQMLEREGLAGDPAFSGTAPEAKVKTEQTYGSAAQAVAEEKKG